MSLPRPAQTVVGNTVPISAVNPPQLSLKADAAAWTRWRKMFESYAKITKSVNKKLEEQVAVLSTVISIDALEIYAALPFANEKEKNDLKRTLELFEEHLVGKRKVTYE